MIQVGVCVAGDSTAKCCTLLQTNWQFTFILLIAGRGQNRLSVILSVFLFLLLLLLLLSAKIELLITEWQCCVIAN